MTMSTRRGRKSTDSAETEITPALGKTIQRLRKAYNMSLGELSEQSGVAKSIISQIERNETNPTIGTVWRLSRALDTTIDEVLKVDDAPIFIEHQTRSGIPLLESEDGLCRLAITGPLNLVDWIQWYDFQARPGGVLEVRSPSAGNHRASLPADRGAPDHRRRGDADGASRRGHPLSRRPAAPAGQYRHQRCPCPYDTGVEDTVGVRSEVVSRARTL